MMKWLAYLIGILGVAFTIIVGVGFFSNPEYRGSRAFQLTVPPAKVWAVLVDVEGLPLRKKEILRVEVMEKKGNEPLKWKEHTDLGGFILFQRKESVPGKKLVIEMVESSFRMKGTWTYELVGLEQTQLTVTEDSRIDGLFLRSIMAVTGRDANLKKELEMIQKAVANP